MLILTLRRVQMEPNGHLVPFVHSLSYRPMRFHLVPNYHLTGDPLELTQGPLGVPGLHFEKHCFNIIVVCVCHEEIKQTPSFGN